MVWLVAWGLSPVVWSVSPAMNPGPFRDGPYASPVGLPDALRPFWHRNAPQRQEGPTEAPRAPQWVPLRLLTATATAYTCSRRETDSTPTVTASGRRCGHPHLAVSRDLLRILPYGTRVWVDGREFIVADTMARHWRNRIDIPFPSRGEALRFGVRQTKLEVLK